MSVADLLLLGLATWRLTSLLQDERGPYAILARFRERFGVEHDEEGEPVSWPDTEPGRLLRCPLCGSVWVGAGLVGLYAWQPYLGVLLALPFALSAIAVGLEVVIDGKSEH